MGHEEFSDRRGGTRTVSADREHDVSALPTSVAGLPTPKLQKTFSASPCFHLLSLFLFLYFFFCQRELYPLKAAEFTSPWKAKLAFAALQLANCLGEQAVNSALELSCCLPNNEQM